MKSSVWTLILGILMIVAGVLALVHPFPASLTVALFAAWSFIILGILQVIAAFRDAQGGHRLLMGLLGLVMIWLGVVLLKNPLEGLVALTIIVALSFIASGIVKLLVGWSIRGLGMGGWVMFSGLISVVLGVMVMTNIAGAAGVLLGLLLGIELLSDGIAAVFFWHASKSRA